MLYNPKENPTCPGCSRSLIAVRKGFVVENEEVYVDLNMYCTNPGCDNFAGKEITEDSKIAEIVRNKAG